MGNVYLQFCQGILEKYQKGDGKMSIVVYRDGSWKTVKKNHAWEYQNDPDWLVTINMDEIII